MVKRKKLGLNFFFNNAKNSGIVNYVFNIVAALNTLPDERKPQLIIFYAADAPVEFLQSINYPYAKYILFKAAPDNKLLRLANKTASRIFDTNLYVKWKYLNKIEYLYPYFEFKDKLFESVRKKIHWLVDFNNMAFPEFYEDNGEFMRKFYKSLSERTDKIVLSSYALLEEMKLYFPGFKNDVRVLRFASTIPPVDDAKKAAIFSKYNVEGLYFISPNQFWQHKNQLTVIEAIKLIKDSRPDLKFKVFFTGSMSVNRGKGLYAENLIKKIEEYKLENYVSFLGILERDEQLLLMKYTQAILQPSLYEGWSTLVEEAKALNQFIILSDLPVHKEQINENCAFFDPFNVKLLSDHLICQLTDPMPVAERDYSNDIKKFGEKILELLD